MVAEDAAPGEVTERRTGRASSAAPSLPARRLLVAEVWVVFAVSLGASAVTAAIEFVGDLTSGKPLASREALLNGSRAPGRPWLDLALQLVDLAVGMAPVALVAYLLVRSGQRARDIGLTRAHRRTDVLLGAALAAVVGGCGLALYLGSRAAGANLTVVPENLPAVWWRIPVLLLSAAQNALLEEVLVVGYLLTRLDELGWGRNRALLASALLRGSYHLYQGAGGFAGNVVMGLLFGRLYQRYGRLLPLVVAHTLIDAVAFVGYALLVGKVSWLPGPVHH